MKAFRLWIVIAAAVCLTAPVGFAQRMFGTMPRDFGSAQMAEFFGKNEAFTATADVTISDKSRPEPMQIESAYAVRNGNLRTEMDFTAMKGSGMSPEFLAQMKQMGVDRTISIYRSDKKLSYLIYPGLKAYYEMGGTALQATKTDQKEPKIEVTAIGKDTIDGHPCVKNKITITYDGGKQHEITAWQASDMHDFPLKTEMEAGGATITQHFHDIKMSAPDAALFDLPTDYKAYGSMQEMMMGNLQRMMPPRGGTPPQGGGDNQ